MKVYRLVLVVVLLLAAFALAGVSSAPRAQAAAVDPSWELTAGPAGVCTDDDVSMPGVEIRATSPASEQGTLTAPGFGQIGYSLDTTFTGVGTFGFTVFTDPFVVPANTHLTLKVTTYNGPNYTGGVSFISTLTWDCTTGETISLVSGPPAVTEEVPVPGCDVQMPLNANSVVGSFVANAPVYAAPGQPISPALSIPAGKTAWVLGRDTSGQYNKIVWSCSLLWVPANSMGPNFDAVWNGKPLPTNTVQ
jgi:hypothetical protein